MQGRTAASPTALGFSSARPVPDEVDLHVEGSLPSWLRGRLVHTGPGLFELAQGGYQHWFDGLALLTSVDLEPNGARYVSRFLESEAYMRARKRKAPALDEFATRPAARWMTRALSRLRQPSATDNGNVNIADLGDRLIAMTETTRHIQFDPASLATQGPLVYEDDLDGELSTAHPQIDRRRGTLHNLLVRFGRRSSYELYELPLGSRIRRRVASLPTDRPSYIHSFGASEQYLVLTEVPLCVHPLRMRFGGAAFIERYSWHPERGTRVRVVNKSDGTLAADARTAPFFAFHHVNAVERDGELDVDLLTYSDPAIIGQLRLEDLRSGRPPQATARLTRLSIRLGDMTQQIEPTPMSRELLELPRIDPTRERLDYRFVYGVAQGRAGRFFDQVIRIDLDYHGTLRFERPNWYPNEPLFVPDPTAASDDEGVLLTIALDTSTRSSRLLIIDARSMELRAHAQLPHIVPFHFHGQFLPAEEEEDAP